MDSRLTPKSSFACYFTMKSPEFQPEPGSSRACSTAKCSWRKSPTFSLDRGKPGRPFGSGAPLKASENTTCLIHRFIWLSAGTPSRIAQELSPQDRAVVIDEIQRLPEAPQRVHRLIEGRGIRFLMTGSSARKLRRGGVSGILRGAVGPRICLAVKLGIQLPQVAAARLVLQCGALLSKSGVNEAISRDLAAARLIEKNKFWDAMNLLFLSVPRWSSLSVCH